MLALKAGRLKSLMNSKTMRDGSTMAEVLVLGEQGNRMRPISACDRQFSRDFTITKSIAPTHALTFSRFYTDVTPTTKGSSPSAEAKSPPPASTKPPQKDKPDSDLKLESKLSSASDQKSKTASQQIPFQESLPDKEQMERYFFRAVGFIWDTSYFLFQFTRKNFDKYVVKNDTVQVYWKDFLQRMEKARKG